MAEIRLIAAVDDLMGIAKNGRLPWDLPSDRKYFQDHIVKGPVIMGWSTFAANNYEPYGRGKNTVMSRTRKTPEGVSIVHDAQTFFENLKDDIWVAGGGQIFKEAMPYATHIYLTRVAGDFTCDVFFPDFASLFMKSSQMSPHTENGITFRYEIWERKAAA